MDFASQLAKLEGRAKAAATAQQQQPTSSSNNQYASATSASTTTSHSDNPAYPSTSRRRPREVDDAYPRSSYRPSPLPPHRNYHPPHPHGNRYSSSSSPSHQQQQQHQTSMSRSPGGTNTNPLAYLERFGYCLHPPSEPEQPSVHISTHKLVHICLLAITIDDLPFEHVWKHWATSGQEAGCYVSLVCHAKYPSRIRSEWLRQRLLVHPPEIGRGNQYRDPVPLSHRPEWGSVAITRAMIDVLRDAARIGIDTFPADPRFSPERYLVTQPSSTTNTTTTTTTTANSIPPADLFFYISETCIPVRTVPECIQEIQNSGDANDKGTPSSSSACWRISWIHARNRNSPNTPKNKYEYDQFANLHRMIPGQFRVKADQWTLLCRSHALAILHVDAHIVEKQSSSSVPYHRTSNQQQRLLPFWNAFSHINASDEMYIPTTLAVLGILRDQDINKNKLKDSHPAPAPNNTDADQNVEEVAKQENDPSTLDRSTPQQDANTTAEDESAATTTKESISSAPASSIAIRPMTYTDWSEGMRNPATFGARDVARVTKLARARGCLFARKFVIRTTEPSRDHAVDGTNDHEISVEFWRQVIAENQRTEKDQNPPPSS